MSLVPTVSPNHADRPRGGSATGVPSSFSFRPVDPASDAALLHAWIATEHARFWGMPHATEAEVRAEYERLDADPHHLPLVAEREGTAQFLVEVYDPAHSQLAGHYTHRDGDAGLHLLLPAPKTPRPGFSQAALTAALAHVFTDPAITRVVVEPDASNTAIHALNSRVGFRPQGRIDLPAFGAEPAKRALLSFCDRFDFARATGTSSTIAAHLDPARWAAANRHVVAKAIGEFSHERLLEPEPQSASAGAGTYVLRGTGPDGVEHGYTFAATRHLLNHWRVDAASVTHTAAGQSAAVDAQEFAVVFQRQLGISAEQLPTYVEELGSTLASHCYKQLHSTVSARELAAGDPDPISAFQRIEAAMTEGHPCFVANNGRIGLGAQDYLNYAPETGSAVDLEWVALHATRARYDAVDGLTHRSLLASELGESALAEFDERLSAAGLEPQDYLYLPVHPWQWEHRLAVTFAADVAARTMVHLGTGPDQYQPQQSIRTFFNRSRPEKHYVKTALSIVNMGFLRGLSAAYMESTPAINEWLESVVATDAELHERRVDLLKEVAAVGYRNPLFEAATDATSAYRKMLAALWRESPADRLAEGEELATMASLLHVDADGKSVAAAMIRRSGVGAEAWLQCYFDAYLVPLVHFLLRYDLVFMPHGENIILVTREGLPDRMLMKDLAEEVAVLGPRTPLPEAAERIRVDVPASERVYSVFTDVFDCIFRFLAPLLAEEGLISEADFWTVVAERLRAYRDRNPELAAEFDELGLFDAEFRLSCLNRLQLRNNQQMLDLGDQASGLIYAGSLENPIASG
ncbi:GNAT family N-acetyltransferase [Zhihengliuella flava]|uniref:Lysine N-acyltransferase MbtK n=1 Tax=Zhihengliuella flava TaxID=1285193 RepID=A0A931DC92_9MICC|nr:GNAT family N-acetyltransferase [Zhihengliuella flava]MBG6084120.1 siderophore synthetase component/RimJ/RimL family protein N-acetyltransferase [Zhihengliuella flava]